jgi:hypothetical protein
LVNTLRELEKNEDHIIYPFVASWNMKLVELTQGRFNHLKALRSKIIERLFNHWIRLEVNEKAAYYCGIVEFQKKWDYPLRIFTLNYDLCVETACKHARIELGFSDDRLWDWRRFEDDEHTEAQIYLYKMHGSIDWKRNDSVTLTYDDNPRTPDNLDDLELIFGTDYKLTYVDPYLYFAYSFRRATIDAKLIISVGYGFADDHINGILSQALRQDRKKKVIAVKYDSKGADEEIKKEICDLLLAKEDQVISRNKKAAEFFMEDFDMDSLVGIFPKTKDTPF